MRSPLTGVVFTLELTHAWDALLPLLIASTAAYAVSVLVLQRSVLTEKIARRGLHLTRDYTTDPLETFFASDAMQTSPDAMVRARRLAADGGHDVVGEGDTLRHVAYLLAEHGHDGAAVLADSGEVLGYIDAQSLLAARRHDLAEATEREQVFTRPLGLGIGRR
jgi:hypothetical protein